MSKGNVLFFFFMKIVPDLHLRIVNIPSCIYDILSTDALYDAIKCFLLNLNTAICLSRNDLLQNMV